MEIKRKKEQCNLFLDSDLLKQAQKKAEENYMKFNAYITKLITEDLEGYTPANAYGEDLGGEST